MNKKMDGTLKTLNEFRTPQLSLVKRVLERINADQRLFEILKNNPREIISNYDFKINPEEIRFLWDRVYREGLEKKYGINAYDNESSLVKEYMAFQKSKIAYSETIRKESAPSNPNFRAWRERQMARARTEFGNNLYEAIVHLVFGVELSKGCSGGCSFCGLNARKFSANFFYTKENSKLWKETLAVLKSVTGERAGRWGFLYWATEPFDNPDYESFCLDFMEIFGIFPHTTTAQPMKNPERTHRFIELAEKNQCFHNRFSILSLEMLEKVFREFSAEEIFLVELVMQNKESTLKKSITGRVHAQNDKFISGQTVACASGFLLNMVERTIQLVSPCSASECWPVGYYIYDESPFYRCA